MNRQSARAAVRHDLQLNVAGIALALLLSALVAWALARRIAGPVAVASNVAKLIAAGNLDVAVPKGSTDELGALLASMCVMRDNIKAMIESATLMVLRRTELIRNSKILFGKRHRDRNLVIDYSPLLEQV